MVKACRFPVNHFCSIFTFVRFKLIMLCSLFKLYLLQYLLCEMETLTKTSKEAVLQLLVKQNVLVLKNHTYYLDHLRGQWTHHSPSTERDPIPVPHCLHPKHDSSNTQQAGGKYKLCASNVDYFSVFSCQCLRERYAGIINVLNNTLQPYVIWRPDKYTNYKSQEQVNDPFCVFSVVGLMCKVRHYIMSHSIISREIHIKAWKSMSSFYHCVSLWLKRCVLFKDCAP